MEFPWIYILLIKINNYGKKYVKYELMVDDDDDDDLTILWLQSNIWPYSMTKMGSKLVYIWGRVML